MRHLQPHSGQKQPVPPIPRLSARIRIPAVPDDAVPDGYEVDAELVGAAGHRLGEHGRRPSPSRQFADSLSFVKRMRMF